MGRTKWRNVKKRLTFVKREKQPVIKRRWRIVSKKLKLKKLPVVGILNHIDVIVPSIFHKKLKDYKILNFLRIEGKGFIMETQSEK